MEKHYQYLIVGGGMAAASAVEGIRDMDSGDVGLFSKEVDPPYNRPPLTKGLWQEGKPTIDDIWRETGSIKNVDMHLEHAIERINREERFVVDEESNEYHYEKLLLATGGHPKTLPFDPDGEQILYFRSLKDFQELYQNKDKHQAYAVIGGGFIGAEISAALNQNGKAVKMIFPEEYVGGLRYPEQLAEIITQQYLEKGVEVYANETVEDVQRTNGRYSLTTGSGKTVMAEVVIAGLGIMPNTTLAENCGLEVEDGILVDKTLRTSDVNIWAAGDVAKFYSPHLKKRIRIEHAENANQMGKVAGRNMAGASEPYNRLPLFYSDMFGMGFEAIGQLDPNMDIVIDWKNKPEKGVVYYLDTEKRDVRGVLLWNIYGKTDEARQLIASEESYEPVDLVHKI